MLYLNKEAFASQAVQFNMNKSKTRMCILKKLQLPKLCRKGYTSVSNVNRGLPGLVF